MSRHTGMRKILKEATNDDQYEDNDPQYEVQQQYKYTEEELEMADNLAAFFNDQFNRQQALTALQKTQGDFDKAVENLTKQLNKKKKKQAKNPVTVQQPKQVPVEIKKVIHHEIIKQNAQQKKQKQQPMQLKQRNSKRQSQTNAASIRKISHQIQQIQIYHYNQEYPKINQQPHPLSATISIVIIGHVDSGKSTLVGQILQQLDQISKKQIHKNQKQSKQMNKESFKYAWVMDEAQEERIRGITIDVGVKSFRLNDKNIIFLDSPGHKQFVPNMITGAVQADYAILLIDVSRFQSSFMFGGQTKEHAYIVRSLGVSTIIVAMNKMDLINWNEQIFMQIKGKLLFYLLKIGFLEHNIIFVPISAFLNINLLNKKQLSYYQGSTLIDLISKLEVPARPIDKPFRLSITNFYESTSGKLKGHCISGKIEGGIVRKQDKLIILPQNCQCLIKQILLNNQKVKSATVGDNVQCQIKLLQQTFFETIKYGNVLSSIQYSIPISQRFVLEILTFQLQYPILRGTPIVVYIGTNKCTGKVLKMNYIFDPKNGIILKKNPKAINSNDCCEIEIATDQKVCVELFKNFKIFGRVIIREKNQTLAVGTVKKIY